MFLSVEPVSRKNNGKGGRGRLDIAFPCYSEGLVAGRGSTESLKFVDPSVHSHRSSTGFDIP